MLDSGVLNSVNNVGFASRLRAFHGFPQNEKSLQYRLYGRDALRVALGEGDLLCFGGAPSDGLVSLCVIDDHGNASPGTLGLVNDAAIETRDFDSEEFAGWFAGNGGTVSDRLAVSIVPTEASIQLRAKARCHAWVIRPVSRDDLISCLSKEPILVSHRPAASDAKAVLPAPLGRVRDEFTVPRGTAAAYTLHAGEAVQIIDMEGQQCSDFMALRSRGLDHGTELMIDGTATRTMVRRSYPGPGLLDKFFDRDMRPMLRVLRDTCGQHDTFGVACTARGYEDRGFPGHLNCSDNISDVLECHGVNRRLAWPAVNLFWRTWVDPNTHHILTEESHSRPGDYVVMRALDDLVCATTACPDDIDPINGWNPTDIHVRIYKPDADIRRAVAYREKEDAPMAVSQESAFHPRTSELTEHFAPARDLWTPVSFPSLGTIEEYWTCREKVVLQDMSGIRKFDVVGPDAEVLLQKVMTRDMTRLAVWRGVYSLMCDSTGCVVDDGTLFRVGPELFRWCCGSEESGRILETAAKDGGLQVRVVALGGTLPNLALQGPASRDVLRKIVFTQPHVPNLDQLKWFGATIGRLNDREGVPFMLTRTGYTGELGYELFCGRSDAVPLWDAIMAAGEEFGIAPMGAAALETIRIEAGLAAANAEFAPGVDAYEAGLGFAVDMRKADFVGKAALERNSLAPRRVLKGLLLNCNDLPSHGAAIYDGERPVGTITSASRSPTLERTIAMARLSIEYSDVGTALEVGQLDGRMKRLPATVVDLPFIDPKREKARA